MNARPERSLLESRWQLGGRKVRHRRSAADDEAAVAPDAAAPDAASHDSTAPVGTAPPGAGSATAGAHRAPLSSSSLRLAVGPLAPDWSAVAINYQAEQFIKLFHKENPAAGPPWERLKHVREEIALQGTYRHTAAELAFATRVAWRNSSRCVGRLYWRSLRVRDRREIASADEVAAEAVSHLRQATCGGRIRPTVTIFAPDAPGRPGPRILSPQLVRYAGYQLPGKVMGDPANVALTELCLDLGWPGSNPPGRFDILPLVVEAAGAPPRWYELPADAVLEVPLSHPDFSWFAELGLRWHAVPVISDMYLEAGGVRYPAAPFNGWYMGTEIGSRNLGDVVRYNQVPVIAKRMGLSTASDRTLWKDRAITELNVAVLHSFQAAGVTVTDHHTESIRFLKHLEIEERQGRACPADWSWVVPPAASSATPVFHRYFDDFDQTPNYYRHSASSQG